jgi:hypothetical protein
MERKHNLVIAWMIGMPCSMVVFFILMACLWEYRVWVGASLLLLIFLVVGVWIRGAVTEQNLRLFRFNHQEETPLDISGEPQFWRPDMKENTHRQNSYQQQTYYHGYQARE